MVAHAFPPAIIRFLAACMLAVVGAHAFTPIGAPLDRRAGSAFSAATHDVSLTGKRKTPIVTRAAPEPDGGRAAGEAVPAARIAPPQPLSAIAAAAPLVLPLILPALAIAVGPFGPRGPPLR